MKYIYTFLFFLLTYLMDAQCATTMTFTVTAPTCTGCCNGSASVSHSCALTYTWAPGGCAGATCNNLCGGMTYTVMAGMASTVCCGSSVATATVFIPAAPSGINEIKPENDLIITEGTFGVAISSERAKNHLLEVTIFDLSGRVVYSSEFKLADQLIVSPDLKKGIYTLLIGDKTTKENTVRKIMIRE